MQGTSRESVYLPLYYSHHFKTRYINWAGGEYQWQGVLIAYYSVKSQYKLEYVINQGLERKVECKEVPDNSDFTTPNQWSLLQTRTDSSMT